MGTTILGDSQAGFSLFEDTKGRVYIRGLERTRKQLLEMGMERNEFEKLMKDGAILVARRATGMAPSRTGALAGSIRGFASKKITKTFKASGIRGMLGGTMTASRSVFGGAFTSGSPSRPYARAVSYGQRHEAGQKAKSNNSQRGYATRVWRTSVQGRGNPFMVRARESSKPALVTMWNIRIRAWIERNGFDTKG